MLYLMFQDQQYCLDQSPVSDQCSYCNNYKLDSIVMNKKIISTASIEASLNDMERKQIKADLHSREEYMQNLKYQVEIRENALKTAETLITAYQKENEGLKEENYLLKDKLQNLEDRVAELEQAEGVTKNYEKDLLRYSQRTNELYEKNIEAQERIKYLEESLEKMRQNYQAQLQNVVTRAKVRKEEQHQRKQLEGIFKNYLKMPKKDESFYSSLQKLEKQKLSESKRTKQKGGQNKEKQILQWKLKQKDQQVMILLRRLQDTEQQLTIAARHNRMTTYDSVDICSTKQSKKNISEFQN